MTVMIEDFAVRRLQWCFSTTLRRLALARVPGWTTEQAHPNGCAGKAAHNTPTATSEYACGACLVRYGPPSI